MRAWRGSRLANHQSEKLTPGSSLHIDAVNHTLNYNSNPSVSRPGSGSQWCLSYKKWDFGPITKPRYFPHGQRSRVARHHSLQGLAKHYSLQDITRESLHRVLRRGPLGRSYTGSTGRRGPQIQRHLLRQKSRASSFAKRDACLTGKSIGEPPI